MSAQCKQSSAGKLVNYCLQRTNVNNNFSLSKDIFSGVPQGSMLGPLMFNVYISDIFLFLDNGCLSNYTDHTTLYSVQSQQ